MELLDCVFLKGYVFLLMKAIAFAGIHWLIKERLIKINKG